TPIAPGGVDAALGRCWWRTATTTSVGLEGCPAAGGSRRRGRLLLLTVHHRSSAAWRREFVGCQSFSSRWTCHTKYTRKRRPHWSVSGADVRAAAFESSSS